MVFATLSAGGARVSLPAWLALLRPTSSPAAAAAAGRSVRALATRAKVDPVNLIRNIGVMAHIDAGKTTTTERMLYYAGMTRSIGSVDDGTTQMDFMAEERERGITIASAVTTFPWRNHRINLIDTPGHVDFTVEVECALRVLDGAVAVFDGVAGVQAQTLTVWRQASKNAVPTIAFVNKMDRDGASLTRTVASIVDKLGVVPLVLQAPLRQGAAEQFHGIVDFVNMETLTWDDTASADGAEFVRTALVDGDPAAGQTCDYRIAVDGRAALAEQLADIDDSFAELVLDDDYDPAALAPGQLKAALRKAAIARTGVPILCGTARRNKGVQPLLDAVVDFLPGPLQRPAVVLKKTGAAAAARRRGRGQQAAHQEETLELTPSAKESMCALIFKIVFDPHRGAMAFARVYSGTLKAQGTIRNSTKGLKERVTRLLLVNADNHQEVQSVTAGNIVALIGLKNASTGDTMVAQGDKKTASYRMDGIDFPEPVFTCSIEAESSQQADDFEVALTRLQVEDPSVHVVQNDETGQTLLSGMGELHLQVVISRLETQYSVKCIAGPMKVSYRERPSKQVNFNHTVERTVGGGLQKATVGITVECSEDIGSCTVALEDLPEPTDGPGAEVQDAVKKGILAACSRGVRYGYPIMSTTVRVTSLEHEQDTSLGILALCAAEATRKAMMEAEIELLHPVMRVEVSVEGDDVGGVMTDLSGVRQGTVFGVDNVSNSLQMVRAQVPLVNMIGYDGALRGMTSGTGSFAMTYETHGAMTAMEILAMDVR